MIRRFSPFFAAVLLMLATSVVRADTITVVGVGSGGFTTATVVCEFNSQTNTFTFTITNTTGITNPSSTGGAITAIGFDLPPFGNASKSGLNGFTGMQAPSLSSDFQFSDAAAGKVPGFNSARLDFVFLTGENFAGGSVDDGLLNGESASFTVTGAAFTGFTEAQICNSIFVRFQGYDDTSLSATGVPEL